MSIKTKTKKAKYGANVENQRKVASAFLKPDTNLFVWAIRSDKIDWEHPKFGFHKDVMNSFIEQIKPTLDSYCSMTWSQIHTKPHCHSWDIKDIDKELRDRLQELHSDNQPEFLYQISLDGTHRIWGYKDIEQSIFYLLFNDPNHDGCKVKKKHT